jgi:single stranded DNA-binding protein
MIKLILIGNVGKDAVTRNLENGKNMITFSVCHNEKWKDKKGVKHEKKHWYDVIIFNGEKLQPHIRKGKTVCVEGKPNNSFYVDKASGEVKVTNGIICEQFTFV